MRNEQQSLNEREPSMRGIEIRENKYGVERFRIRIRKKGKKHVSKTYRTATLAKKNKCRIESALEIDQAESVHLGKLFFKDLVERYIQTILPQNPKNSRNKRRHLFWWNQKFGYLPLRDIKPNLIALARDELLATKTIKGTFLSPTTVVRYLSTLSHAFAIACKEWEWIKENPILKIKKPQPAKGRLRFLNIDEKDRLLAACKESDSKDLYLIVILAISTGMRRGEILNLSWRNIDFETETIWLDETKNGEQRFIPLIGIPLTLLKSKYAGQSKEYLVFPSSKQPSSPIDIRSAWEKVLKVAGIENCVFHSLRHTTASNMAMDYASLIEIAELLGHKTLQTTKRYAHLSDKHLRERVLKLQTKLFLTNTI